MVDFFSPQDQDLLLQKVQLRINRIDAPPTELSAISQDGSPHPFLFTSSLVVTDGKNYLVGTGVDISARKKIEAELHQAQKMEAIGTLAGGIAHDFNNILSAIIGYTELSQLEAGPNSKISSFLAGILQAAIRARDLVQQILTFSRKQDNSHLPLQIAPLFKEALRLIRSSIPVSIDIKTHITADDAIILADPTQIHQVIVNLCTNGYQSIEDEYGTLNVSLQEVIVTGDAEEPDLELEPGHYILIKVTDTGIGMDQETIHRIFEPYFTTKDIGKGTGLGLALVDSIVSEHRGIITVDSVQGKGTTISVYLPALKNTAASQSEPAQERVTDFNRNGSHIVCVDDEPYILGILEEFLREQGFRVTGFEQSADALDYICSTTDHIDLLITDMTMPKMNGLELGRQIFNKRPDLPVILCTGYSRSINREKAAREGFACYIEKPLILSDLTAAIQGILAPPK
jgi:signal transduction histidine kinase